MNEIAKIKNTLLELGITPDLKGYHYIKKGVMLIKRDFENGKTARSFIGIYEEIGNNFNTTKTRVERAIRHAIEVSERSKTNTFNYLFGGVKNVTASAFLCVIAEHISEID